MAGLVSGMTGQTVIKWRSICTELVLRIGCTLSGSEREDLRMRRFSGTKLMIFAGGTKEQPQRAGLIGPKLLLSDLCSRIVSLLFPFNHFM